MLGEAREVVAVLYICRRFPTIYFASLIEELLPALYFEFLDRSVPSTTFMHTIEESCRVQMLSALLYTVLLPL